jgi:hypothetical protein
MSELEPKSVALPEVEQLHGALREAETALERAMRNREEAFEMARLASVAIEEARKALRNLEYRIARLTEPPER